MTLSSGEKVLMQIVGFNCDELASGNGVARISWLSKMAISTKSRPGNKNWSESPIRDVLQNTIKPLIPVNIKNGIVNVSKVSSTYENGDWIKNGESTADELWIPSLHEMYGLNSYESIGAVYTTDSKVRKFNNSPVQWWLRSRGSNGYNHCVADNGTRQQYSPYTDYNIVFGFCTGAKND